MLYRLIKFLNKLIWGDSDIIFPAGGESLFIDEETGEIYDPFDPYDCEE